MSTLPTDIQATIDRAEEALATAPAHLRPILDRAVRDAATRPGGPSPEAVREAVATLQAELTAAAPAIARLMEEPLTGEDPVARVADNAARMRARLDGSRP